MGFRQFNIVTGWCLSMSVCLPCFPPAWGSRRTLMVVLGAIPGMATPYAADSSAVLRVLDTGMYMCLFFSPWVIAGSVMVSVWLQSRSLGESSDKPIPLDFGVLVIAGYQTVLSQSTILTPSKDTSLLNGNGTYRWSFQYFGVDFAGGQYHNQSVSSRFIVIAFILVCLFLSILFSSFVKASMMNKPPTKRIPHLKDLIRESHLRPLVVDNTYITDLIKVSQSSRNLEISTYIDQEHILYRWHQYKLACVIAASRRSEHRIPGP